MAHKYKRREKVSLQLFWGFEKYDISKKQIQQENELKFNSKTIAVQLLILIFFWFFFFRFFFFRFFCFFLLFLFFIWTYLFFFVYFLIALVAFFVSPITIFFFFFWHVQLHLSNLSSRLLLNFYFFFSNSHVDHHQTLFFSFSFSFSYYFQTRVLQKVKKTEHCRLLIEENSSKIISNSVRWFFCVGFFVWQLFFNWKRKRAKKKKQFEKTKLQSSIHTRCKQYRQIFSYRLTTVAHWFHHKFRF